MQNQESKEVKEIREKLRQFADKNRAAHSKSYLKSDYDFHGIPVPQLRQIAKQYKHLSIYDAYNLFDELWNSNNHEEMSLALFILENLKSKKQFTKELWNFLFLNNKEGKPRIEKAKSWDHIDEISSHITGEIFLLHPELQAEIKQLSTSKNPWMRRLSIVSQYPNIKKGKIQLTLLLAEKLVYDNDIYVQKGAGWMLRECGKKFPGEVESFIKIHKNMKPASFSYATEKMIHLRKLLKEERKKK
jgi:3-methyladenine DNA glycosylase AlkD